MYVEAAELSRFRDFVWCVSVLILFLDFGVVLLSRLGVHGLRLWLVRQPDLFGCQGFRSLSS